MAFLVPVMLIGVIPIILILFATLPPRRAVIVAFIFSWLFLPVAGYQLPGLPDYTKGSATGLGVLLATLIFHVDRLLAIRPRWFDLPMVVWCLCPVASSLSNGLGLYDGCSSSFGQWVTWGLPYLIGRIYFTRFEHLRELTLGLVAGGLIYAPLCIFEMRMSPQLSRYVYGFFPRGWGEVVYGGFYRPQVFMSCALELGLWMTATATTSVWLWASGSLKQLRGFSSGGIALTLVLTAIFCMVAGAWSLLIFGVSLWFLTKTTDSRLPAVLLILLPVLYMTTRGSGVWSGDSAVELVRTVLNERRAQSLAFRMYNENLFIGRTLERPMLGWGGWGRAFVKDENGRYLSVVDGMWIIAFGNHGVLGLTAFEASLLLPMTLLVRRYPARAWRTPTLAPTAVLAVLVNLYAIDCLANAMLNPIYILAMGALTGPLGASDRRGAAPGSQSRGDELSGLLDRFQDAAGLAAAAPDGAGSGAGPGADPREEMAIRFSTLGRSLQEHGMLREAEEMWGSALHAWAGLAADHPGDPEYRRRWLDALNDCAWTLVAHPGLEDEDVSRAILMAEQAVSIEPDGATYWNTLGIAYFRGRDWDAAIDALGRSAELSDGGTSFDYFFLAMAHWRLGDRDEAHRWFVRGNAWMEEHDPEHETLCRFRDEAGALLDSRPVTV